MSFIATLIALLLEQARPLAYGNLVHVGVRAWASYCAHALDAGQPRHGWLVFVCVAVMPAAVTLLIHWWVVSYVGVVGAVVWSVVVLYLTLGFRQFSHHFTSIRDALDAADEGAARKLLAQWRHVNADQLPRREIIRHVIEYSIISAHRHVFGVLVWFSLLAALGLGPAGAVFYRLVEFVSGYWKRADLANEERGSAALNHVASQAWFVVDWIPARMTALCFAVVGSFEEAIDEWRQYASYRPDDNDGLMIAATAGAVNIRLHANAEAGMRAEASRVNDKDLISSGDAFFSDRQEPEFAHLNIIVGLIWRSVVLWMLLLALLTLARLLG